MFKIFFLIMLSICWLSLVTATPYLHLDNHTFASFDEILQDPFLVLRTKTGQPQECMEWRKGAQIWAQLEAETLPLPLPEYYFKEEIKKTGTLKVLAPSCFDHSKPSFFLDFQSKELPQFLWWQISTDSDFLSVYSNLNVQIPYTEMIQLSDVEETFLNPGQTYYFRISTDQTPWSRPCAFQVQKPACVQEINFSKIDDHLYELSWQPDLSSSTTYLVFASNALDFVPSLYCDEQWNVIDGIEVLEKETIYNFICETTQPSVLINSQYAFYRIIARDRNQLAVPSPLIYIFDQGPAPYRTYLKQDVAHPLLFKRQALPSDYENQSFPFFLEQTFRFLYNPLVPKSLWQELKPYFLPINHPIKARLDRLFGKKRVTQSEKSFEQAGFGKPKMRQPTNIVVGRNPEFQKYIFKIYLDTQPFLPEWEYWVKRIEGANAIRACIKRHGFKHFSVPHKWIYPLPEEPSPPSSAHYHRKNFILIADNMEIMDSSDNLKAFKEKMSAQILEELFIILTEEGLIDSVYPDNIPFTKKKQISFIDTEHHHRTPVPYHKLIRFLSPKMQSYWRSLIE